MTSLFDYHSDSKMIIDKYYSLLMSEADRGTILLGVSIIDEQLNELFKRTAPSGISNNRSNKLFDSRGPFGELSSKLDIALVCNLIPINIIDSIHKLRKLRNNLAHRTSPFSLKENLDRIYDVFTTLDSAAPSCFIAVSESAIYDEYVDRMMKWDIENNPCSRLFTTKNDVIHFILNKPELLDTLMEKRIKALFIVGVSTIAALIIFHREIAIEKIAK